MPILTKCWLQTFTLYQLLYCDAYNPCIYLPFLIVLYCSVHISFYKKTPPSTMRSGRFSDSVANPWIFLPFLIVLYCSVPTFYEKTPLIITMWSWWFSDSVANPCIYLSFLIVLYCSVRISFYDNTPLGLCGHYDSLIQLV